MKLTPASSAWRTIGSLRASSKIQGFHWGVPIFIVPRHRRETFRPDWPRRMYSMKGVSLQIRCGCFRSRPRSALFGGVERVRDVARGGEHFVAMRQAFHRGKDRVSARAVVVFEDGVEIVGRWIDPV